MDTAWFIGFMVVIGAVIGGATNSLAIKMLFRPYTEKRIGKWRVPFTPGLIPKRHQELATQLGHMVVHYLLTAEGLGKKLKSTAFMKAMNDWLSTELLKLLRSELTIGELLEDKLGVKEPKQTLLQKTEGLIEKSYDRFFQENRYKQISEVLPRGVNEKIDHSVPVIAAFLLERGQALFSSEEGKERLSKMIDRFLLNKGTLGNMISMFLGNERLVDKLQPELMKFMRDDGTKRMVEEILEKEWAKLKQKDVALIEDQLNKEEIIEYMTTALEKNVPFYQWVDQPLCDWSEPFEDMLVTNWVPKLVDAVSDLLALHLEGLLEKLNLEDIVREQVEAFSVERLEELVLTISKREFKMITYLGALLGGMIGFIQGLLVLFIG
ncbi:DUF445 family protein [Alkalihalophilus pseudofirmus]|uniref:DUF445 family protein n=1 Tax=Alkalihalophilus pseudofirmus TaxID=79885 RepID=A0AAJ2U470_ALKPS|nr:MULTISPECIES: DUF445 family protein [Alkalihalophilus]MDV2886872.1 DUF445 family protein [Alkalihalophilus pseudofirmus]MED1600605.1 DUF445 family protein [Alkalihalophilus marmarensis]